MEVQKSDIIERNASQGRIRYLCFGSPPAGKNGGNTAGNTHRVLRIVHAAIHEQGNHGDGGWSAALSVCTDIPNCICLNCSRVRWTCTTHSF